MPGAEDRGRTGGMTHGNEPPESLLRSLLDSMLEPFVLLTAVRDDAGTIVDFEFTDSNPAAQAVYQMTHEELAGQRLLTLHPAAATTDLFGMYVNVVESGTPMVLDDWSYPQDIAGARCCGTTSAPSRLATPSARCGAMSPTGIWR